MDSIFKLSSFDDTNKIGNGKINEKKLVKRKDNNIYNQ